MKTPRKMTKIAGKTLFLEKDKQVEISFTSSPSVFPRRCTYIGLHKLYPPPLLFQTKTLLTLSHRHTQLLCHEEAGKRILLLNILHGKRKHQRIQLGSY